MELRHRGVDGTLDISVDITTSGDGVQETSVDGLHGGLEMLLDDTVELEGL